MRLTPEDDHRQHAGHQDADAQLGGIAHRQAHPLPVHCAAQAGATAGVDGAVGDGIGLHAGHQKAGGNDGGHCEGERVPLQAHGLFDVVRRATAITAIGILDLVDLRQRRFHIRGGCAEKAHHPHPEDRARPAEGDGGGHAGGIANANAPGQGHRQGLERRHAGIGFLPAHGEADHFHESAHLHEAGADGEVHAGAQTHEDQCLAPDDTVDAIDECFHAISPTRRPLTPARWGVPRFWPKALHDATCTRHRLSVWPRTG